MRELTLFGGLAKAQILPPIAIGVWVSSGIASSLVLRERVRPAEEFLRFRYDTAWTNSEFGVVIKKIPDWEPVFGFGFQGSLLLKLLMDYAIARYFEVWGPLSWVRFRRAIGASDRLQQSFAGHIGSLNSAGRVKKIATGEWKYIGEVSHERYVSSLSESGVKNVKETAYKLRDQRLQGTGA